MIQEVMEKHIMNGNISKKRKKGRKEEISRGHIVTKKQLNRINL
jgi:hypothetical protein